MVRAEPGRVATRSMLRHAAASPRRAAVAVELAEAALLTDHDPMTEAEWGLVGQDLHLACTVGVLTALSPETRRLHLLGEVLAVPDRVGAEAVDTTPAAFARSPVPAGASQPWITAYETRCGPRRTQRRRRTAITRT